MEQGKTQELEQIGFQQLLPEAKPLFDHYFEQMNGPLASFSNFISMIAWGHSDLVYYKVIQTYLVCVCWEFAGNRMILLPFFGNYEHARINETFQTVEALLNDLGIPMIMTDVREWMLPYYKAVAEWEITSDRGLCDYIYRAEDFENSFLNQKGRYNYRYFINRYAPKTETLTASHLDACIAFLERTWCAVHICEDCACGCLKIALSRVLTSCEMMDVKGILVRTMEKVIGYCIVGREKNVGIYHFMKAERGFRGLNEYLHRECYERFLKGIETINYTEDMNFPGLRKHKEMLAPHTLEPNYEMWKR